MLKLKTLLATVAISLAAAAPAAALDETELDRYVASDAGDCVFDTAGGDPTRGWCPDWRYLGDGEAASGDCVFRAGPDGTGGLGWCPDWAVEGTVTVGGDCVFRPLDGTRGSLGWCPDWKVAAGATEGTPLADCVFFRRTGETAWCPDWAPLRG